jgi:hypothetical protein
MAKKPSEYTLGEWQTVLDDEFAKEIFEACQDGSYDYPKDEDEDDGLTAEQAQAIADLLKRHDAGSLGALFKRWKNK